MFKYVTLLIFIISKHLCSLEPVIVLIGPPGSGKGTFSQYLKQQYGYNHISAGDIVRREITKRTAIGIEIEEVVKKGSMIPMQTMHMLIASEIKGLACQQKPFIIDGFPRSEESVSFLYDLLSELNLLSVTFAVFLDAKDSVCAERILGRLVCSECGCVYNVKTALSKIFGTCDFCQASLLQRLNDTPEITHKRICEYRNTGIDIHIQKITANSHFTFITDKPLHECLIDYSQFAEIMHEKLTAIKS